ncbi:hypothetical protein AMTR_s00013p00149510 [Amborella trichopoda]|uniref:Uncharacterized protein n=1 Tax=Amborella trichopoda TaxID=13333 RepID=W1PQA1_AMBTC|nr:hypothetical protein AMTR_s00013p00149510 [Amborella trichopoda]
MICSLPDPNWEGLLEENEEDDGEEENAVSHMLDDMGLSFNIPLAIVYQVIKANLKKAKSAIKVSNVLNRGETPKTSAKQLKGKKKLAKAPLRSSARIVARRMMSGGVVKRNGDPVVINIEESSSSSPLWDSYSSEEPDGDGPHVKA